MYEDFLFLIPARGGSKGIPRKNIRELSGKPLIYYTLDAAKAVTPAENICVSTDDDEIISKVEEYGIRVPFKRPPEFATDTASSMDVIRHALDFFHKKGRNFAGLVLLQPTSPLRTSVHIKEALTLFSDKIDLVVSVKITSSNPYFVLYEENSDGFLELSKKGGFTRRQDCPVVYERNGAIYIYNTASLGKEPQKEVKYLMDQRVSVDIDTELEWQLAELILANK